MGGILSKSEKVLLASTALFLCVLLSSAAMHRPAEGVTLETARYAPASAVVPVNGAKIDINTAPAEELTELPGIGEKLAERIIAYREAEGPFAAPADIQNVSGIGPAKFAGMEDMITTGDAGADDGPATEHEGAENG